MRNKTGIMLKKKNKNVLFLSDHKNYKIRNENWENFNFKKENNRVIKKKN